MSIHPVPEGKEAGKAATGEIQDDLNDVGQCFILESHEQPFFRKFPL